MQLTWVDSFHKCITPHIQWISVIYISVSSESNNSSPDSVRRVHSGPKERTQPLPVEERGEGDGIEAPPHRAPSSAAVTIPVRFVERKWLCSWPSANSPLFFGIIKEKVPKILLEKEGKNPFKGIPTFATKVFFISYSRILLIKGAFRPTSSTTCKQIPVLSCRWVTSMLS